MLTIQEFIIIFSVYGYIVIGIVLTDWAYRVNDKHKPYKYSISCMLLWPIVLIITAMYVIVECYRYIMHKQNKKRK
jgi:hypothetical protein|nr:MAG TPA: Phosphoinositide-interacting protein family [Caudoviricetes sp.]